MKCLLATLAIVLAVSTGCGSASHDAAPGAAPPPLTDQEREWISKASKREVNGWLHVRIQGAPFERGFQYGYLVADEYAEALRVYEAMTLQAIGMEYSFFVEQAARLEKDKITPELLEEMKGIAAGLSKAGVPTTLDNVIGWNAYTELTGYWWPTVATQYATSAPPLGKHQGHCSAFIATGSATADGGIVIGHETFTEFWNGQFMNVILDITPNEGHRIVMQTSPGWIASMTDFWVTGAGIVVVETTLVGYEGYDDKKVPEYVRARTAAQYAADIDGWVKLIDAENNGGYANAWLVGDIETGEIARYEQGLVYQSFERKHDGWYFGANVAFDPQIRNLESSDTGFSDVRQQTGARRVRWPQLLGQYEGRIDVEVGQTMLADQWDPYLLEINPSSRTIAAHYDVDPMEYVSDPNAVWNVPYTPAGSVDGKVTTSALARDLSMWGRFGRADGVPFDADEFLRLHPQWNWQEGYLESRPSEPWTLFRGGE